MALSNEFKLMRYVLFSFNLILWLSGAILAIMGIGFRISIIGLTDAAHESAGSDDITNLANLLICVGFSLFIIGFLGCCGAWKMSTWMLCGFAELVTLVIVLELGAVGLAVAYRHTMKDELLERMKSEVEESSEEESSFSHSWHIMQKSYECCGVNGPEDYKNSNYTDNSDNNFPESCCVQKDPNNLDDFEPLDPTKCQAKEPDFVYLEGCYEKLKKKAQSVGGVVIVVVTVFVIVQILGVVFAVKVRKAVLKSRLA